MRSPEGFLLSSNVTELNILASVAPRFQICFPEFWLTSVSEAQRGSCRPSVFGRHSSPGAAQLHSLTVREGDSAEHLFSDFISRGPFVDIKLYPKHITPNELPSDMG